MFRSSCFFLGGGIIFKEANIQIRMHLKGTFSERRRHLVGDFNLKEKVDATTCVERKKVLSQRESALLRRGTQCSD